MLGWVKLECRGGSRLATRLTRSVSLPFNGGQRWRQIMPDSMEHRTAERRSGADRRIAERRSTTDRPVAMDRADGGPAAERRDALRRLDYRRRSANRRAPT